MCPHLASGANASLGLIDDKDDFIILSDLSQSLVEVRCGHLVLKGGDGLNNDSSNVLLLISPCHNGLSDLIQASILFSSILMLELCDGVSDLGEGSAWPVKGRHILHIHSSIAAGKGAD